MKAAANPDLPSVADVIREDARRALTLDGVEREVFLAERAAVLEMMVADPLAALRAAMDEEQAKAGKPATPPKPVPAEAPAVRIYTAEELMTMTPELPEAVLPGYVFKGSVTELASKVKTGKTTLLLAACRAIIHGEPFLGHATTRTRVLYLTEERPSTFAAAMRRVGLDGGEDFFVLFRHDVGTMSWPEVCDFVAAYCRQHDVGLVPIDTLSDWAGLSGDEENQAGSALEAIRPVQALAATGPAVVVVRHERKSGGELGESARGSSAFAGAVDVLLSLRSTSEDNRRELHAKGRFDGVPPRVVIELGEDGQFTALGDPRTLRHLEEQRALVDALGSDRAHALTLDDLRDAAGGVPSSSAHALLGELRAQGVVCAERGVVAGHPRAFGYWLRGDDD